MVHARSKEKLTHLEQVTFGADLGSSFTGINTGCKLGISDEIVAERMMRGV